MKTKKILSLILALSLILSFSSFAYADNTSSSTGVSSGFKDLGNSYSWASEAINYMARQGIVNGTGNGNFEPQNNITREQFAKILVLTFNESLANASEETFSDVSSNRWSYQYIEAVKYYLTGYYPPKGKPIFDPTGDATREDIAVALVKMMGYKAEDLQNPNILDETFTDADDVSPNLKNLVSIAVEKKLIKGNGGMLRPLDPITRAEVSVLLYRAMKASVSEPNTNLKLEVEVPDYVSDKVVFITGITEAGAKVTINDEKIDVDNYGRFKEQFMLKEEGNYSYTIKAQKDNRKSTVQKNVTYAISAPVVYMNDLTDTTNISPITISGWVWDNNDKQPQVSVNGNKVEAVSDGSWTTSIDLQKGANTITVKAVNKDGKNAIITKQINFSPDAPVIDISSWPEVTDENPITVSGYVYDVNDINPQFFINDTEVKVGDQGVWSTTLTLNEGKNIILIKAVNKLGKTTKISKELSFNSKSPILEIINCPETTNSNLITLSGTVKDSNDDRPRVYINDNEIHVNSNGSWSATVKINDGISKIKIEALNKLGKTTTIEKTITLK